MNANRRINKIKQYERDKKYETVGGVVRVQSFSKYSFAICCQKPLSFPYSNTSSRLNCCRRNTSNLYVVNRQSFCSRSSISPDQISGWQSRYNNPLTSAGEGRRGHLPPSPFAGQNRMFFDFLKEKSMFLDIF